jgi:dihydrolipoamide dehydrogenase
MEEFDVIIIGSGQAGTPLSTAMASAGKETALIEQKFVGGTCINFGCTPTKTMVASAEIAYLTRRADDYGIHNKLISVDMQKIRKRKDDIVKSFREGSAGRIEKSEAELIYGKATFTAFKTIRVDLNEGSTRQMTANTIIIDSGGKPRVPDLKGLKDIPFLDSTSIMELEEIPEHLLIMGGGNVALEFGQMFHRFGSKVTIIELGSQLLPREDADIAEEMIKILNEDGIDVLLNTKVNAVSRDSNGTITLSANRSQNEININGSHLLVAIGRTPNSADLNLTASNIAVDEHGYIKVNDQLETNVDGVYAVGDVKGGHAFTHISYDDYRILKANLLEGKNASIKGRLVPYVLYTDPQLGRVGITENQAKKQGINYKAVKIPMNYVARALEVDRSRGLLKAIVDLDTRQILGAALLGAEGGELMSMIEIAMMGNLTYPSLRDGIFAHPTYAEALNNLFSDLP